MDTTIRTLCLAAPAESTQDAVNRIVCQGQSAIRRAEKAEAKLAEVAAAWSGLADRLERELGKEGGGT